MDIAGAKALQSRLGSNGTDDAPEPSGRVPASTLPVYQWLGISQPSSDTSPDDADPES